MSVISTPITELFGIKHPILLAGASMTHFPSHRTVTRHEYDSSHFLQV